MNYKKKSEVVSLYSTVISMTKYSHLNMLGNAHMLYKSSLDSSDYDKILSLRLTIPQYLVALFLTPINQQSAKYYIQIFDQHIYNEWSMMLRKHISDSFEYEFGFIIKFIKASYLCGYSLESIENIVNELLKLDSRYAAAVFYIGCLAKKPLQELRPVITKNKRIDTLCFYYAGLNRMIGNNFADAKDFLNYALQISKCAKDMKKAIIHKLGLVSYLMGESYDLFISKISPKDRTQKCCDQVWSENGCNPSYDKFTLLFQDKITKENNRRKYIIDNNVVKFKAMRLLNQIRNEINIISTL